MDRATARTFVALKAEDKDMSFLSSDQYDDAIDLAEEQFAMETRAIFKTKTDFTVVAGQNYVDLPDDFLVAILLRHRGIKVSPTSIQDLAFRSGTDWTAINGTPKRFYVDEENERIIMVPNPQDADAGQTLNLLYACVPAHAADTILLGRQFLAAYHPAVVAWAAHWVLSYKPATQEILIKQAALMKQYETYRDQAIETYKNMQDQPIQMKGGRNWQDNTGAGASNAFSDN